MWQWKAELLCRSGRWKLPFLHLDFQSGSQDFIIKTSRVLKDSFKTTVPYQPQHIKGYLSDLLLSPQKATKKLSFTQISLEQICLFICTSLGLSLTTFASLTGASISEYSWEGHIPWVYHPLHKMGLPIICPEFLPSKFQAVSLPSALVFWDLVKS